MINLVDTRKEIEGGFNMSKKNWSIFVGLSLTAGLVSSLLLKNRKRDTQLNIESLSNLYRGQWFFIDRQHNVQHTLQITSDLTISIDDKPLIHELLELTTDKMTIRDQYGYHLIFQRTEQQLTTFYDEANDCHYLLDQKKEPR